MNNYSIIISTCDKFSDLWEHHLNFLIKNWRGELPKIYLVSDKESSFSFPNVIFLFFDGDFPERIKNACELIDNEYIILTLDDYFLINETDANRISFLVHYARKESIDYLSLFSRRADKEKIIRPLEYFEPVNLSKKYAVNLYPAIWKRTFLIGCVRETGSPWSFEAGLSKIAFEENAKCYRNYSNSFKILDVVRKGKLLRDANKYLIKNGIHLKRPLVPRKEEARLKIADFVNWHTPMWFKKFCKKVAKGFGMKFYSDD